MSRYAYADPPYPGMARLYAAEAIQRGGVSVEVNHELLIAHLCDEFPDGWALSTSSVALQRVLAMCPSDVRVTAWCKSFAAFKVGVNPGYCWEPVILRGGRSHRARSEPTVRDFLVEPITMRRGFPGAKPDKFVRWVLDLLGAEPDDEVVDLFPGSGAVGRAVDDWRMCELGRFEAGTLFEESL